MVQQAHLHGLQVWIYTLPYDLELFYTYVNMGVDAITVYEVTKYVHAGRDKYLVRPYDKSYDTRSLRPETSA